MEAYVPVTAKLSRKFYETFGDDVATEFVDWFNTVDAQYRTEMRQMLDAQFRLMRSELEQRLDQRLTAIELRLDRRVDAVETQLERMEARLLGRTEASIAATVGAAESRLQRLMIGLWMTTILAVVGTRFL
jgi:hypothetical protein